MARKKRTKQESRALRDKIAELKKQGRQPKEIASELGVTRQYVSLVLAQAGLAEGRKRSVPKKPQKSSTEVIDTISRLERQGEAGLSEMLRETLDRRRGKKTSR